MNSFAKNSQRSDATAAKVFFLTVACLAVSLSAPCGHAQSHQAIRNIVIIIEENHSFDNLFGTWEGADGLPQRAVAQVDQNGQPLKYLPMLDVNLTSPPLPSLGSIVLPDGSRVQSAFPNSPFNIDTYIPPAATTCPRPGTAYTQQNIYGIPNGQGLAGGCTMDLVHRFYQEQYQINGGKMDRYIVGSDGLGLSVGYYSTSNLPISQYLNPAPPTVPPRYSLKNRFFHAAFGGSFLNHQWLITARTPIWPNADNSGGLNDLHSVVGPDGYPGTTLLHPQTPGTKDGQLTHAATPLGHCLVRPGEPYPPLGTVCGDFAVNTMQPPYQPFAPGTPLNRRLPPQTAPTVGDRLSEAGIDWAWYSGGWDNANGNTKGSGWTNGNGNICADPDADPQASFPNCPDKDFQYHHQPFNYYARYAPDTGDRAAHLRDETEFLVAAQSGKLKPVSFVKPIGRETEHPGYASESAGSTHLVALLKAIFTGPQAPSTMVIVTYDESGGEWDHVPPPAGLFDILLGKADEWGPGTRVPALVISNQLRQVSSIDNTEYDTTSILATIAHRFGLRPLNSRDAAANDLFSGIP